MSTPPWRRDHPRIRGEHRLSGLYTGDGQGSSPHTRGALAKGEAGFVVKRIIPAYAGSTQNLRNAYKLTKDHPRIRGEHAPLMATCKSSPWIIPAYAGSTLGGARRH